MKWSEYWKFKAQIPFLTLKQIEVTRLVLNHYAKEKRKTSHNIFQKITPNIYLTSDYSIPNAL